MGIDKKRVHLRFARAADTYDRQSFIQRQVADHLLNLLVHAGCDHPESILEIGCCTGLLTGRLTGHFTSINTLHVNDLVDSFKKSVEKKIASRDIDFIFLSGDIEQIRLPQQYDLIISSSTFHWLDDLPGLFNRLHRHLRPGGFLGFAMYGPDNLWELKKLTGIGLEYAGLSVLRKMVAKDFNIHACEGKKVVVHFDDPLLLLQHLRETGVNALARTSCSRRQLQTFRERYEQQFGSEQGVRLTYHPMYIVARTSLY